jgi:protein-L-isoaspartate(D-aspartate) O-methyltransferase
VSEALARSLEAMGIRDRRVLEAMARLPRHLFVPPSLAEEADLDRPLPIGRGQTISQPYVTAFMTERLELGGGERVLEVGTGSGYQAAVLALLARDVYSIEIVPELAARARDVLHGELGLANVHLATGDGALGWAAAAPFDRIIVTAASPEVPPALLDQLAPGGRMILPFGGAQDPQVLRVIEKGNDGANVSADVLPVRFVPLTGAGSGD